MSEGDPDRGVPAGAGWTPSWWGDGNDAHVHRVLAVVALSVAVMDQLTKWVVLNTLGYAQERVVIDGFFKFVHWGNTGAAYSLFSGNNELLTIVSLVALMGLFLARRHFEIHRPLGCIALALMLGGIIGNVTDRLLPSRRHVIDFLYFFTYKRSGEEAGFPAFNIADTAICTGVGLLLLLSWRGEEPHEGNTIHPAPPGDDSENK